MDKTAPAAEAPKAQPKISQKMLLRFAIGLFVLAALFFAYRWWSDYKDDPDLPAQAETAGMIAAVMDKEDGSEVVIFNDKGELIESPGYSEGKTDKEPMWRPDGNRLFFVSNRDDEANHVYRWNLAANRVMRRSYGTRSQNAPTFAPPSAPGANESALITAGGFVLEFNPHEAATRQVLPPVGKEIGGGDEGAASQFEQFYQKLGNSFRSARWGKNKDWIAAVMHREDETEILIIQNMRELMAPVPIVAGDRIEFDVNPQSGAIFFAVNGFRFHDASEIPPEMMKNGRVTLPFTSVVGMFDPEQRRMDPITHTNDARVGFHDPKVSPDGTLMLFVAGKQDANGMFVPENLIVCPAAPQGGAQSRLVMKGQIREPSWAPDSHKIAFIQRNSAGKRGIFTINKDGSALTDVTKDKGDFSSPIFSPQKK